MRNTAIRPSPIDGRGLFAVRAFKAGETVEVVEYEIVLRESQSKYAIPLKDHRSAILLNKTKFVNHSREPNVVFRLKEGRLVAVRDIAAGEELTSAYGSVF